MVGERRHRLQREACIGLGLCNDKNERLADIVGQFQGRSQSPQIGGAWSCRDNNQICQAQYIPGLVSKRGRGVNKANTNPGLLCFLKRIGQCSYLPFDEGRLVHLAQIPQGPAAPAGDLVCPVPPCCGMCDLDRLRCGTDGAVRR